MYPCMHTTRPKNPLVADNACQTLFAAGPFYDHEECNKYKVSLLSANGDWNKKKKKERKIDRQIERKKDRKKERKKEKEDE